MTAPTRLSDNRALRAMTVQQADALFQEIALLTVKIEKTKAQYEKRISEAMHGKPRPGFIARFAEVLGEGKED